MTAKRIYFFSGDQYLRFDAVTDSVNPIYPRSISPTWPGLFPSGIDAAMAWHSGKVFFFSASTYTRYDVLLDAVDPGYPRPIAGNWPGVDGTGFEDGIDAAVNWGNGQAFWFKGGRYLRLVCDVTSPMDKNVEASYPKPIAGNWPGIDATGYAAGIDAAVNWGNGQVFMFKGDTYVGLQQSTKTVDPGYPWPIADHWPGVFTSGISAAVSWPLAEPSTFQVPTNRSGWLGPVAQGDGSTRSGEYYEMEADYLEGPHPTSAAVGEYRQYVRGAFTRQNPITGATETIAHQLPDPAGGPPRVMQPTPPVGATADNFLEDGNVGGNWVYGHRRNPLTNPGTFNQFLADRENGTQFRGTDFPGLRGAPGTSYAVSLDFRGQSVDSATGGEVMQTSDWTITGAGAL